MKATFCVTLAIPAEGSTRTLWRVCNRRSLWTMHGRISIDPCRSFTSKAKRTRRMAKQLRTLHDAIAAGKDFDLQWASPTLLCFNERRGPATFDQIGIAVERHLTDQTARRFFMDSLGVFWRGSATMFADRSPRELAGNGLIEDAIARASGAKKSRAIRQSRKGSSASPEQRSRRQQVAGRKGEA